jgi:hypothetical protein
MERLAGVLSPAWRVTQRLPDPEGAGHAWHGRAKGAGVTEMAFVALLRFLRRAMPVLGLLEAARSDASALPAERSRFDQA